VRQASVNALSTQYDHVFGNTLIGDHRWQLLLLDFPRYALNSTV
jgi:hypothetical protein